MRAAWDRSRIDERRLGRLELAQPGAEAAESRRGVSTGTATVMAATQRPLNGAAETEKSGPPAWTTTPSWYMVATEDQAIPPATERFMAKRANATTVEVRSSHVAMISHPAATTHFILEAARAVS